MSQEETVGELSQSVGYMLKQAAAALRSSMDSVLRPLALTVPQYACLELLGRSPGQSNAELARGAFVTRQSMNEVLRGLQDRDLVTRPDEAAQGRSRPTTLTDQGRLVLREASVVVARVEKRMLSPIDAADRERLLQDLAACAEALISDSR